MGSSSRPLAPVTMRGPVGGAAKVVLGDDNTQEIMMSCQQQRNAVIETPAAVPRFSQAPGGTESQSMSEHPPMRGPVGGEVSVVFGESSTKEVFTELRLQRDMPIQTPTAAPRFSQAPGGTESEQVLDTPTLRGPIGGE